MKKLKITFSRIFIFGWFMLCASFVNTDAQEIVRPLGLWPRGDKAYLAAGQSMPLWPQLPPGTQTDKENLTFTVSLPSGFSITSWGKSTAFAVLPKPLLIPSSVTPTQNNANNVVYTLQIPAAQLPETGYGRLALMVNPGANPPGDYAAELGVLEKNLNAKVVLRVLPPLNGKRPRRLQISAYNYNGLTSDAWLKDMEQAVLNSGINRLWDMWPVNASASPETVHNTLVSRLVNAGVDGGAMWFWKRFATPLGKRYPQAVRRNAAGKSVPDEGIATTWVIANRDKIFPLLQDDLKSILATGLYHGVVLDHEERAISRDNKIAEGDIYNPGTMEAFANFAKLDETPAANPALIAEKYPAQWIAFRTRQSAQLSAIVADALQAVEPFASYGLYSGYQYAPPLEGRTQQWYSVDWNTMASEGKIQFGSAGYGGSAADLKSTASALGDKPFIPAAMYVVNFQAPVQWLQPPDHFAARLLSSTLSGDARGGFNVWYLSVLDAAAYSAIAQVSRLLADVEPFLLDGKQVNDALNLPRDVDAASVFAWQLEQRRLVIVVNRSAQDMNFRAAWKEKLPVPDTKELVSGKNLGNASLLEATLKPNEFAAFLTFSDGN
jgi:hypothetical protein